MTGETGGEAAAVPGPVRPEPVLSEPVRPELAQPQFGQPQPARPGFIRPELYAITGKPVAHSRSPQMHNAACEAAGVNAVYVRIAAEDAADALATARSMGVAGMNVTAPFKEGMAGLCDVLSEEAKAIGAVNTVVFRGRKAAGHNTDAYGVKAALEASGTVIGGAKAVVLGAGGAATAAAYALVSAGATVIVANRTVEKAKALAKAAGCSHCSLAAGELAKAMDGAAIIVSALSTDERVVPEALLRQGMTVMDAKYDRKTALAADAERNGCKVIDGREWLLYQGAKAFGIFTGKEAPVEAMRRAVYHEEAGNRKRKTNLALIGFMGSGKTSVSNEIAKRSGSAVVDTDAEIEKATGKRVRDIFASRGEGEFRKLEKDEVMKIAGLRKAVVACGGGVVLDPENVRTLRDCCTVVWLWADVKATLKRIGGDDTRPLLSKPDREKTAKELMDKRLRLYAAASDIVIGTEGKLPAETAGLVLDEVGETLRG